MSNVVEINDIETLENYRLLWSALLPQTRGASMFHSLDWLKIYWRHFGERMRLRVLIVEGEEGPIGILPLVVTEEKRRIGNVRVLTYPLADWGAFYGPIGPNPTATLMAGLRHIQSTPRDWDMLQLRWVDREGWDHGRTENALRQVGLAASESHWTETAQVATSGCWDEYWASRKSHWRTNVRRSERKLRLQGDVRFLRYRPEGTAAGDDDPRWDLYNAVEEIARQSWQGESTDGTTISHDSVRSFLRDVHVAAARAGTLDMGLLLVDDVPTAFAYNYHYRGYVFGLRAGFDRRVASDGAGTVLTHEALRDSFERGDHTYDLGPGYLECKRHWLTRVKPVFAYSHYPATAGRAQMLRLLQVAKQWMPSRERRLAVGHAGK